MDGKLLSEARALRYLIDDVDDAFNAATDFTELCFQFLEERLNAKLPRKKEQLIVYLKTHYKELIK